MQRYYFKLPFALANGCRHLVDSFGWNLIDRLLKRPELDFLATRAGQTRTADRLPTIGEARELVASGFTLRFRHAERFDDALAGLADSFRVDFAAPIDCHAYCTGGDAEGLSWHYDAEDVFVLQTEGTKEWWLRKNTVHPWPVVETLPVDMQYEREIMPVMRCSLDAGDWLYVPGGYWHRTHAAAESVSLSIGVMNATALDVFDYLRISLVDDLRWRQRLPVPGAASTLSKDELIEQYRAVCHELGADLQRRLHQSLLARDFLSARQLAFPSRAAE
jgi:ribosomal protein L16 Arg81 hydroxylase